LQSKTIVTIFLSVLLCFASFTSSLHSETLSNRIQPFVHDIVIPSQHSPVSIRSDSDFETQGWPGNGSVNNPFRIENLSFEISDISDECIIIENVSSHFLIQNCSFSFDTSTAQQHYGAGVSLREVSNGRIINCSFTHFSYGIFTDTVSNMTIANCSFKYSSQGIYFWKSREGQISNNTFLHCLGGLQFERVGNSTVTNNTFLFNSGGILIYSSSDCNLTSNLIAYNRVIGVVLGDECHLVRIFGNKIAFNQNEWDSEELNAHDDGYDNLWDDNVYIGNEWGDYSGSGNYTIPGLAGSIDRFPSLTDLVYLDLVGPKFYHLTNYMVTAQIYSPLQSLDFYASVSDQTGVDTVLLYYSSTLTGNWSSMEMDYQPTTDNYHYSFDGPLYSFDFISYYYYWANDTLGQETVSYMHRTTLYISSSRDSIYPIILITGVGGIVLVFILVILKKKKS